MKKNLLERIKQAQIGTEISINETIISGIDMTQKKEELKECPQCGSIYLIKANGLTICDDCATVLEEDVTSSDIRDNESKPFNELFPNIKNRIITMRKSTKSSHSLTVWNSIPYQEKALHSTYLDALKKYTEYCKKKSFSTDNAPDIICKTLILYKEISKEQSRRNPIKMGIIAICFNYISKEKYVIWTKKELAEIFQVDVKYITRGNNLINKFCKDNKDFCKMINRSPITLNDMLDKIRFKFKDKLSEEDFINLKKIIKRVEELPVTLNNTPRPIMSGIFANYIKVFGVQGISIEDIIRELPASPSSISKYINLYAHVVSFGLNKTYYVYGNQ